MSNENTPSQPMKRRQFLWAITGSALAVAAGCRPSDAPPPPTAFVPGKESIIPPTHTAIASQPLTTAVPDTTWGAITYDDLQITSQAELYITQYDYSNTPTVDAATWTLTIDGLVDTPQTFTLDQLKALTPYTDTRVLECISDPVGGQLIGNLHWTGVRMADILALASVKPTATHVRFYAADGYATSVALNWVTQPDVMLAYYLNDEPLTVPHGFPLRIHMPGLYGQKMPRWLTRMEFIDYDFVGYWESKGWSATAEVRTRSVVRRPNGAATVNSNSKIVFEGFAFAGERQITAVEIQINDGEAVPVTLVPKTETQKMSWTQWYYEWDVPAPGEYRVLVRATDDEGFKQNKEASGIFGGAYPNGTDAIHSITVKAV
jgi:DMSO/TMAO reductase YedYZ molybdopterin-dependent catalytic subunit